MDLNKIYFRMLVDTHLFSLFSCKILAPMLSSPDHTSYPRDHPVSHFVRYVKFDYNNQ